MPRLHVLVEGQTEEVVVNDAVKPYFSNLEVWITTSIFTTKRPAGGPAYKGGLSNWPKISRELRLLLRDRSISLLTTMFDYYAFPADGPAWLTAHPDLRTAECATSRMLWQKPSATSGSCRT